MALPSFRVLSVCSGGGGLDLGLRLAEPGAHVVGYVEREAFAASVLVARMAKAALHSAPIWDDVASFDGRRWRGVVDCVVGGFPCQPWSIAGRRRGTADDRWLWPQIARLVREVAPSIVFLENVPGLASGGGLEAVLGDLAELRFDAEWEVLGAEAVGAPHRRRRVFVLAHAHRFGRWARAGGGRPARDDVRSAEGPRWVGVCGGELASAADERGPFPPGPTELERWAHVLGEHPDLAPALEPGLRRVADGMAGRLDEPLRAARLRMLANGVVPMQAALAWRVLLARALGGEPMKCASPRPRWLRPDERERLLAATQLLVREHTVYTFALGAGLRCQEIAALDVGDVSDGRRARECIAVRGARARSVPASPDVRRAVDRYVAWKRGLCPHPDTSMRRTKDARGVERCASCGDVADFLKAPLFTSRFRERITPRRLREEWHGIRDAFGLRRTLRFSALRATFLESERASRRAERTT